MSTFSLKPLPYGMDSLEPHISSNTVSFHYEKHHAGYVKKLNSLLAEGDGDGLRDITDLEHLASVAHNSGKKNVFNNAAQILNHDLFWESMKPGGGGKPSDIMGDMIDGNFGSYEQFYGAFKDAALSQFGSGWIWLVQSRIDNKLSIIGTSNADNPFVEKDLKAILVMDVWEHAYYLDYKNDRATFATRFLSHLVNWDFALSQLLPSS